MTSDEAIELYDTKWWESKSAYEIVKFQLYEPLLCMPFGKFHQALEEALDRPVWTHELALNYEGIKAEFEGLKPSPSMNEIINLIPEEKRIIVGVS